MGPRVPLVVREPPVNPVLLDKQDQLVRLVLMETSDQQVYRAPVELQGGLEPLARLVLLDQWDPKVTEDRLVPWVRQDLWVL